MTSLLEYLMKFIENLSSGAFKTGQPYGAPLPEDRPKLKVEKKVVIYKTLVDFKLTAQCLTLLDK